MSKKKPEHVDEKQKYVAPELTEIVASETRGGTVGNGEDDLFVNLSS